MWKRFMCGWETEERIVFSHLHELILFPRGPHPSVTAAFATSWAIAIPKESGQVEGLKASMRKLQKALVENKGQINYNTNS